jgi:hypothetical protein
MAVEEYVNAWDFCSLDPKKCLAIVTRHFPPTPIVIIE